MYRQALSLLVCALVTAVVLPRCDAQDDLQNQLIDLRAANAADYDGIIDAILKSEPTTQQIADAIRAGVKAKADGDRKEKLVAGWSAWEATDVNGVTRPYQVFLPKSIVEGGSPTALIVHMHGAVGRPEFGTGLGERIAVGYAGILWPEVAEKEKYIVVCPIGRAECSWWTDNGVAHVNAVIRDLRRSLDIPENSIFGAGFSDGASGCYYMAMAAPDPFAGFIALNGHPRVGAIASGKQLYLGNMSMSVTVAAMTQQDSLYPSKNVLPHIVAAIGEGADILTVSYPKMNHQPSYFTDQTPAIVSFIEKSKRARRDEIQWYASSPEVGKFQWLELLEFASAEKAMGVKDTNVMSFPSTRMQLGIGFSGFTKVSEVANGSVAATAGVKVSDEMVEFDGQKVSNARDLRGLLGNKTYGDEFTCKVKRGDSVLDLTGKFPVFVPKPIYCRNDPTGWAKCRFDSAGESPVLKVQSKNVTKLRVWLPKSMASLDNLSVSLAGEKMTLPVKHQSAKDVLKSFAGSASSFMVKEAYVDIEIK